MAEHHVTGAATGPGRVRPRRQRGAHPFAVLELVDGGAFIAGRHHRLMAAAGRVLDVQAVADAVICQADGLALPTGLRPIGIERCHIAVGVWKAGGRAGQDGGDDHRRLSIAFDVGKAGAMVRRHIVDDTFDLPRAAGITVMMQDRHRAAVLVRIGIEMKRQQDFGNAVAVDIGGVHIDGLGRVLCRDDQVRRPGGIFVPVDRIGGQAQGGNIGLAIIVEVGDRLGITLTDAPGDVVDDKGRGDRRRRPVRRRGLRRGGDGQEKRQGREGKAHCVSPLSLGKR